MALVSFKNLKLVRITLSDFYVSLLKYMYKQTSKSALKFSCQNFKKGPKDINLA